MSVICKLRDLTKEYDGRIILSKCNMDIEKGSTIAIIGNSGSGKSTLLNIISLLERFNNGKLELFGSIAPKIDTKQHMLMLREKIGYLFQNFALISSETIGQNLDIALAYRKLGCKEKVYLKTEALKRVGLDKPFNEPIYKLSGGEQQRVALARILLKSCDLIIADEPTGSVDEENTKNIIQILMKLNKDDGKTIILVTHDIEVARSCKKIYKLDNGKLELYKDRQA